MAFPMINPVPQFFDTNGAPLSGGTIEFRSPIDNTFVNSYPTAGDADAETNPNSNPLTLTSRGEAPSGLYLQDGVAYNIILKDSGGTTIWSQNNVRTPLFSQESISAQSDGDPRKYGAIGDGSADDSSEFATAEAAVDLVHLGYGTNYNLGSIRPTKPVHGPGSITLTGSAASPTVSGFEIGFDAAGGSIVGAPDVWAELANGETSSPGSTATYFNVILAPGSNANDSASTNVWRSTIIGEAAGETVKEWERVEAIGQGAMRFAEYAQRTTAIGSISFQWLGTTSQQKLIDRYHDFWLSDNPGSGTWDFHGLETRRVGVGQEIAGFNEYPTDTTTQKQNVAVGRDAGLHLVKGSENTAVGYQSGAHWFVCDENTAIGDSALRDCLFGDQNTALGRSAGIHLQDGGSNLFLGRNSGINFVEGARNCFIGVNAGTDLTFNNGKSWDDMLVVQWAPANNPLLIADMSNRAITLNIDNLEAVAGLNSGFYNCLNNHIPSSPGRFLGTTTSSVASFVSYAGATTARSHAIFENTTGNVGSITTSGSVTSYNTTSDERLKEFVGELDPKYAAEVIRKDPVREFKWISSGQKGIGWGAQTSYSVSPDLATPGEGDELWAMDRSCRTPYLWAAVSSLLDQVVDIKERIDRLAAKVDNAVDEMSLRNVKMAPRPVGRPPTSPPPRRKQ